MIAYMIRRRCDEVTSSLDFTPQISSGKCCRLSCRFQSFRLPNCLQQFANVSSNETRGPLPRPHASEQPLGTVCHFSIWRLKFSKPGHDICQFRCIRWSHKQGTANACPKTLNIDSRPDSELATKSALPMCDFRIVDNVSVPVQVVFVSRTCQYLGACRLEP